MKSADEYFADWESHVFGYGYGSGEPHTIPALKDFMGLVAEPGGYDSKRLEAALGPTVAWLLINTLCHADIIEYGTSPRYGWLTPCGVALKAYIDQRSVDDLLAVIRCTDEIASCYPDACNCGPNGHEVGRRCGNPFWIEVTSR